MKIVRCCTVFVVCVLWFQLNASSAMACQETPWQSPFKDLLAEEDDPGPAYVLSGDFTIEKGKNRGLLNVVLDIKDGWHGYSQSKLPGQYATVLEVESNKDFKVVGKFTPNKKPKSKTNELGAVEEFKGQVIWSAPVVLADGVNARDLIIQINVAGQVCKQSCVQFAGDAAVVKARFSKYTDSVSAFVTEHGSFSGKVTATEIEPGSSASFIFEAKMSPGWHIYKYDKIKPGNTTPQPTIIYFTKTSGFAVSAPVASNAPIQHETGLATEPFSYYHEDKVQWKINVKAPTDIKPGTYLLEGKVLFQLCTNTTCDRPTTLDFRASIKIGSKPSVHAQDIAFVIKDTDRDKLMEESKAFWEEQKSESGSVQTLALSELGIYLVLAFFAGLILNAMPCVLPVIGLKVMSFIHQAGEKRGRIFMLNFVFSLGLLTVFWILAALATFFDYGWGDLLTKDLVGSIVATAVVFAFGLSMLGVWELPIPGLSGSSSVSKKSEEEGLLGAFFLGVLTTVLATPCTGPLLIPAVTVTVGQPPWIAFMVFTTIGLGMALPYLLVGLFPSLISWLPRPGAWMNTFKQVTGFVLMGTVVFFLSSFANEPRNEYMVAMLSLLLIVAFACWWIGRTSLVSDTSDQLRAWGTGAAMVAAGSFVVFTYLGPAKYELDWQRYSKAKLGELKDQNRLVFIDFTGPN